MTRHSARLLSVGRPIRTLREMGLPLTAIATVVASRDNGAELMLHELACELEKRNARRRVLGVATQQHLNLRPKRLRS